MIVVIYNPFTMPKRTQAASVSTDIYAWSTRCSFCLSSSIHERRGESCCSRSAFDSRVSGLGPKGNSISLLGWVVEIPSYSKMFSLKQNGSRKCGHSWRWSAVDELMRPPHFLQSLIRISQCLFLQESKRGIR